MAPLHLLCLLLCTGPCLSLQGAPGTPDHRDAVGGRCPPQPPRQNLPVLLARSTETLVPPAFRGPPGGPRPAPRGPLCGIECQRALPPLDRAQQERILGYETLHENGTRTRTRVSLGGCAPPPRRPAPPPRRGKRQVFGADGRFVIGDAHFAASYPFAAAARLSSGCSGVLVSPRHVLTAASCLHDGTRYLQGVPGLRVGLLQLKTRGGGGGGGGGGRRRGKGGRRRGKGGATPSEEEEEEEGHNAVDAVEPRGGGRGRPSRRGGRGERGQADGGVGGAEGGGRRGRRQRRAAAAPARRPAFRWSRVRRTHVPAGWLQAGAGASDPRANGSRAAGYDYALLELRRPVRQRPLALGVAPGDRPLARVHFSGFDLDRAPDGGGEKVVYRFCGVAQESDDLIYQRCDAQRGAAGAGLYIRARQGVDDADRKGRSGRWRREVIGVFSGERRVEVEGGGRGDFNVAVRITPAKHAQICLWIRGGGGGGGGGGGCEAL